MSRIPDLKRGELDPAGQQIFDDILAARGSMAGPFGIWMHSPEFTRRATQLGEFLRYQTTLEPRLSELVILITARCQKSEVEWSIHEPIARKARLSGDVIEALQADETPRFSDEAEKAIYDFCTELHRTHTVEESTLHQLTAAIGNKAAVEVTGLCGYYTMVAMTLNAFAVQTSPASGGTDG
ncbi:carboxymuconolactone decarboxylase family protein [bacterium]|nr:MAG: carboxymuconolactone decarboxylase family protein [bacterium]